MIDTSYLLELYKVEGYYSEQGHEAVKKRFTHAITHNNMLFVPLPCIYELGNHIANIRNGHKRYILANEILNNFISPILNKTLAITITPANTIETLENFWLKFATDYVKHTKNQEENSGSIGLVDATIVEIAQELRNNHNQRIASVHIWTSDVTLKSLEPDSEENPFTG